MSKTFAVGITALLAAASAERNMADRYVAPIMSERMMRTMEEKSHQWESLAAALPQNLTVEEGPMACVDGMAGQYPCDKIDLLAHLPLSMFGDPAGGGQGNDIWGWTSPSGQEIAIAGTSTGTGFIDVVTGKSLGFLPTHTVASSWRDVKVYGNYALIISEAGGHGMQIFDMTTLPAAPEANIAVLESTVHLGDFGSSHNVVVNEESGYAYVVGAKACRGGLYIVNVQDPLKPTFEGCYSDDGYTHDAECVTYTGPDSRFQGHEICFNYNENTLTIVDVTDKADIKTLSRTTYTGFEYTHQGWLTQNQGYVLMDDELDQAPTGTKTLLWDVRDLTHPIHFSTYLHGNNAIAHNLYTKGNFAYCSNYNAGLRVVNMTTIDQLGDHKMDEVAFFDVFPQDDEHQFSGMWSSYIYFPSGKVISQSIPGGLYIMQPNLPDEPAPSPPPAAECAPGCPVTWQGDGYCTEACNVKECNFDLGDCAGSCDPACPASWHKNVQCDLACNTTACGFDDNWCAPECSAGCMRQNRNDGTCNEECNTEACHWDGPDGGSVHDGDCKPSCSDGVLNGDELRKDCGGSCPACADTCPFLSLTDHDDMLGCSDGTQCNRTASGWGCCVAKGANRNQCPPSNPVMCAIGMRCGGGKDFCCGGSVAGCAGASGGPRLCREAGEKYYKWKPGMQCPEGDSITDLDECKEALVGLSMDTVTPLWTGDYDKLPAGCSFRQGHEDQPAKSFFNAATKGTAHDSTWPVCKINHTPYYFGAIGTECAEGMALDQAECVTALTELGKSTEEMWVGKYAEITGGCSYRPNGGQFKGHFNSHKGQAHAERMPVCKKM